VTVAIRPERAQDFDAIDRVVAAAFGKEDEAILVRRLRSSDLYRPELALVAERDGAIVGHVMVCDVALVDADTTHRVLSLAPLAVAPSAQRTGIGSALVREVAAIADGLGEPLIVLQGSPQYYGRLGFVDARTHGIDMALPEWAPIEAAQVLPLTSDDPALRGTIVYSDAFDGLE